jgi:hypothetical protein
LNVNEFRGSIRAQVLKKKPRTVGGQQTRGDTLFFFFQGTNLNGFESDHVLVFGEGEKTVG